MQRVDPKQFFSKIPVPAIRLVGLAALVLAIVMAASWSLSFLSIVKGLGFGILFIVAAAQPIAFYWARRDQTATCNQRIGLFILIGGLLVSSLVYILSQDIVETLSVLILPVGMCLHGFLVKPE